MRYIGIDLGTSAVKALLVNREGQVLRACSKEYPLAFPHPGWSEQNPGDWENAVWACLRELGGDGERIAGIGVAGQMHGLVALDKNDEVIRPAILWNDGRSIKETAYLNDAVGREKLSAWTGNVAFAGFTAPKLLWMKENEPENFNRISKLMLPKDYIVYRLTGVHSTDMSDASGFLLLDVKNRRWSSEMLEICGVTQAQMPGLFESYEVVGCVKDAVAKEIGLQKGVRVVAGAGDNAAAAIGTGTVGEGSCNISLGTSGTVFIAKECFGVDNHNALHAFAHADGSYHLMGCMLSAAACNKWWLEDILHTKQYGAEQAGITADTLGKNGTFWLPYLMGERSPHNDPAARGAFIGMRMDTTRAEMTQAVLEGVSFALRDSLEVAKTLGVTVRSSKLCGGGAKSALWQEMIANIMNIRIELLAAEEGPGLGGAMLAAVGCGAFSSVAEAAKQVVRVVKTIEPTPEIAARYEERYQCFRGLYPALKPVFAGL
ncbi:xylulokinase [Christensenellaceae bacterium OttesenSCG-928-M15]|nr:xylulokinase [Christensenellaceae bacterium OttesenSCG-928-M15]